MIHSIYNVLNLRSSKCSDLYIDIIRHRRTGIAPSLRSSADCRAHPKYELRSYAPSARRPWLNDGLFEHRVQTSLITERTLSTFMPANISYVLFIPIPHMTRE